MERGGRGEIDGHHGSKSQRRDAPLDPDAEEHVRLRKPELPQAPPMPQLHPPSPVSCEKATVGHNYLRQNTAQATRHPEAPGGTTAGGAPEGTKGLSFIKIPGAPDLKWLKTSNDFGKSRSRNGFRSPTPTPAPRVRTALPKLATAREPEPRSDQDGVCSALNGPNSSEAHGRRSDSAAKHLLTPQGSPGEPHIVSREPLSPQAGLNMQEIDLRDMNEDSKQAYENVKTLSRQACHYARNDCETHVEAKKLAEGAASKALTSSPAVREIPSNIPDADEAVEASEKDAFVMKRSTTSLPAFEYRKASFLPKRNSFREDHRAAKNKVRAEEKRRLSFTASGRVKERRSQTSSRDSPRSGSSRSGSSLKLAQRGIAGATSSELEKQSTKPSHKEHEGATSGRTGELPEAQVVQQPGLTKGPSAPSTELLETERQSLKFPSTDEGDSYLDLSTQAAMLKAQRSFHKDIQPSPSPHGPQCKMEDVGREMSGKEALYGDDRFMPRAEVSTPTPEDNVPMSTQAMMDAMSPFAVTTVKKRPLGDLRSPSDSGSSTPPSPTNHEFRATSPSMSSTPPGSPAPTSHHGEPPMPLSALSKPTSTITSFSIAPNGTMTEIMQYDGQQQQNHQMGDSDLDAALEEAGSFLGDWSVEKEARYMQRSTGESRPG